MTLVVRAGPSPTSLRIPSIKQLDLRRHREGTLASPLQNLSLFNELPCLPFLLISSSPVCSPSPAPLSPSLRDRRCVKVATCYWPEKAGKRPKERATLAEGEDVAPARRGWTVGVGFPGLPPGFYWGEELVKARNSSFGGKSDCSRQGRQGESTLSRVTHMIYAPCAPLGD